MTEPDHFQPPLRVVDVVEIGVAITGEVWVSSEVPFDAGTDSDSVLWDEDHQVWWARPTIVDTVLGAYEELRLAALDENVSLRVTANTRWVDFPLSSRNRLMRG